MRRASGILLHITSLPSPYGIGTFGHAAYAFADFLSAARQSYWQVLPLGPTSYGDSPYQSFSAIAGNPYFIDLDTLVFEGLLDEAAVRQCDWGDESERVDYGRVFQHRLPILFSAYQAACRDQSLVLSLDAFIEENAAWLDDYALFMALKDEHDGRAWIEWEEPLRAREQTALEESRQRLHERIRFHCFLQQQFSLQWRRLKAHCNERGVSIIGDVPIYVPLDSADVWAFPEAFQLDADRRPRFVAGVPPDAFTADGQLWGNPLFDWEQMKRDGYAWWKRRMNAACARYDVIRFDHFRGLSSYWRVPAGETTAIHGDWVRGPGMDFIDMLHATFPDTAVIAEDLGYLNDEVRALVLGSGYPGMKVLQFAFDTREAGNYLPHTYPRNCVCYTGTHDNTTCAGWFSSASRDDVEAAKRYLGLNEREGYHWGLIRGGMSSVATLFIAQMQDYLGLDGTARMNVPGTIGGNNWRWRMQKDALTPELTERIARCCKLYGRG